MKSNNFFMTNLTTIKVFYLLLLTINHTNAFHINNLQMEPIEKDCAKGLFKWIYNNATEINAELFEMQHCHKKDALKKCIFKEKLDRIPEDIYNNENWRTFIVMPENDEIPNEDKKSKQNPFFCYIKYDEKKKARVLKFIAFNSSKPLELGCANKYYRTTATFSENNQTMTELQKALEKYIPEYILPKED
jgi:hypothetical protein